MSQPSSVEGNPRGRVPFSRPVELHYPLFQDFIREVAANISLGGMFIESAKPLPVSSEFDFEISLDEGPSLIAGRGKVAWVRHISVSEAEPAGMGVTFLQLARESMGLVRRIVDEQRAQGDQPFDLLDAAIVDPPAERFSKEPGGGMGRRGSLWAYWFSVAALSVAVGGMMVFAFDRYYVQPRLDQLQRDITVTGSTSKPEPTAAAEQGPADLVQPPPEAAPSAAATPETSDPVAAVKAWATAWENGRIDDYLDSYSAGFRPSGGRSRELWASQRSERIARQSNLRVDVTLAEVESPASLERLVTFVQSYASDTYRDRVRKRLRLVWEAERWKIAEETVIRASA